MDSLPTTSKPERRWRSKNLQTSKSSVVMAFFSCLAWLYVAGCGKIQRTERCWADLLRMNSGQRPKVLSVEDKLMILGCKDLEKRIVEAEMDLTLAKSQGYQSKQGGSSSGQKLLAVIGVYTGFGSHLKRNVFRGSWMPKGDALKKLEERGVVIRFVIGRSPNRGDSLDRNVDEENLRTKDFLILEAEEELPKKVKFFLSAAVQSWDAEFYVKVNDDIDLDLDELIKILEKRRGQDGAYIGCMKSGDVITEEYFQHTAGPLIILSRNLAQHIHVNSASLKTYAHDDVSLGSWMMGLQATYTDDVRLCCGSSRKDKVCSVADCFFKSVLTANASDFLGWLFMSAIWGVLRGCQQNMFCCVLSRSEGSL